MNGDWTRGGAGSRAREDPGEKPEIRRAARETSWCGGACAGEEWRAVYTPDDERLWFYKLGGPDSVFTVRDLGGKVLRRFESADRWGDYFYLNGQLLAKVERSPGGLGGGEIPAPPVNWTWRHFHLDHLGTPRLVTDAAGAWVAEHEYFPFGQEVTPLGEGDVMKFTGHERDLGNPSSPADDLDYMHARHFSALTGRFLSVDPVLQGARAMQMPQLWNRYLYALGNPMIYVDPTGEVVNLASLSPANRAMLIKQLQATTGLLLAYDKKSGNLRITGQAGNGSGSEVGSKIARADLKAKIDSKKTVFVISRNDSESVLLGANPGRGALIELDFGDIEGIDYGENATQTFDAAMIFLHELKHTFRGLQDPKRNVRQRFPGIKGETVEHMNRIRKELGLPIRESYGGLVDEKGRDYIPFASGPIYIPGGID